MKDTQKLTDEFTPFSEIDNMLYDKPVSEVLLPEYTELPKWLPVPLEKKTKLVKL